MIKIKELFKISMIAVISLAILWFVIGKIESWYQYRDNDINRGAVTVKEDKFGDKASKITYLDQNWSANESLWFYSTTQGSDLLPYDFFLVLEQADSNTLFRDNENMDHYRYLTQYPTTSNPDGFPVGMTKDTYQGKDYMGFTCAACHTAQVNYQGTGIRIDGGPALADFESFFNDLGNALQQTEANPEKQQRFINAVLAKGNYSDNEKIKADLAIYKQRIMAYNFTNKPTNTTGEPTHYGYARLDAFGRIYNRVLEHVMSGEQLTLILQKILTTKEYKSIEPNLQRILSNSDRDSIIDTIATVLNNEQMNRLRLEIYNPANAPVSYPFLWDTPQHDYVQWNGIVQNAGLGALGRNVGEVIGVFGTMNWSERDSYSLATFLGGQGSTKKAIDFQSSVDIRNVSALERQVTSLTRPEWPEELITPIDHNLAKKGEVLFADYCVACHQNINPTAQDRRIVANMTKLDVVGTDPKMSHNSVQYLGYSGIIENEYVGVGVGSLLLEKQSPVAPLLTYATKNVIITPDGDKWWLRRWAEQLYDLITTFKHNEIQPSIKRGDYVADTTVNPFNSLSAYKGRALDGIWSTAPYLHNGSVPSLYHLLLPKKRPGDPDEGEYRPDTFTVGSRELDAEYVGLKWTGYDGFIFDTNVSGNSNQGHEYAAGRTPQPNGEYLPALDKNERLALVEYMKTL